MQTLQHLWPPGGLTLELVTVGILTLLVLPTPLPRSKRSCKEVIATNIPRRMKGMSTAIFDYVETMQWREANILAGGMVVSPSLSFRR